MDPENEAEDRGVGYACPTPHEIKAMCAVIRMSWSPEEERRRDMYAHWRQAAPHCPGPLAEILRDHK
jgi:hypothetical protein